MWSAIKSDLFDFVTTIQEDTTKTISKVLGDDEEEENGDVMQEKIAKDVRRSFETYGTPVGEINLKKFQRFLKTFSLGAYAHDIGFVLDDEPEVSRFYAELVPAQITPEEFWSRLFFRLNLVYRNESVEEVDDEDEEELAWDADEVAPAGSAGVSAAVKPGEGLSLSASVQSLLDHPAGTTSGSAGVKTNSTANVDEKEALASALRRVAELENENSRLNAQVRTLVRRVAELEQQVQTANTSTVPLGDSQQAKATAELITDDADQRTPPLNTARKDSDAGSTSDRGSSSPHSSHSSSGVVVGANGDAFSLTDDDSRHGYLTTASTAGTGTSNAPQGKGPATSSASSSVGAGASSSTTVTSRTTATYLAAVDDEDEEEDGGWN